MVNYDLAVPTHDQGTTKLPVVKDKLYLLNYRFKIYVSIVYVNFVQKSNLTCMLKYKLCGSLNI